MSDPIQISGVLTKKDAKRLTTAIRGSTIGPTTLYYAGVTAPIIGAGMALMAQNALEKAAISPYWVTMLSAIIAAMAGIVWYLIFIRWSYRHRHGRSAEMQETTHAAISDTGLTILRGAIETRIPWGAVTEIKEERSYTLLRFDGTDPLMVPKSWFQKDKTACKAFIERVKAGMKA